MYTKLKSISGGWWLFKAILGLFAAQAIFIAVSSPFPMAFDENYHFSLIQYYSHSLTPIITSQPADLSLVGDATRLTSYLSHYILGFVLNGISYFTHDLAIQVIVLRFINITFVIAALVLFRLFLMRFTKSGLVSNLTIMIFCLLPVTSLLAAHINYDNAMLLCFAAVLLVAQSVLIRLNSTGTVAYRKLLLLTSLAAIGCLIKFTFLPIAAAIMVFIVLTIARKKAWHEVRLPATAKSIDYKLVGIGVLCLVSIGLCAERYGGNIVQYHILQPDCAAVQPLNTCMQYGPWARNYELKHEAASDTAFQGRSLQGYIANLWAPLMTKGLGFIGNGQDLLDPPQPVKYLLMMLVAITSIGLAIALVAYRNNSMVGLVVLAAGLYTAALLQRNYSEFMQLHELVAVQGRYIVPLLIPIIAISMKAMLETVRLKRMMQPLLVGAIIGLMVFNPYVAYSMVRNGSTHVAKARVVAIR